jgi:hypothetical protein
MWKTITSEASHFAVVFALAVFPWAKLFGASWELGLGISSVAGGAMGIFGGIRGATLVSAKRRMIEGDPFVENLLSEFPDVDLPSQWQLKSGLAGLAATVAAVGFIVWGIVSLVSGM